MAYKTVPLDFVPSSEEELERALSDPFWRVCSGFLYKIMVKKSEEDEGSVVPFKPNRAQRRFMDRLWHRNIILKARQLGFTTLICIMWLDHALFNADQRCGIIAQDRDAAKYIFRDKVQLAYKNLPPEILAGFPTEASNADEILFAHNNSSVRVATSMRSGTIHRLHVSEFGKICAKFKDKAVEVSTGSLPAVPLDGIAIIESTAEGQEGEFFTMTELARANHDSGKELTQRDYRFHFFPWWQEPGYTLATALPLTDADIEYFDKVEVEMETVLTDGQRSWYVATRDTDFGGDPTKMWREYPSTPTEPFKVSTEGTYYATQITAARKQGRIATVPYLEGVPVNTFWDIGAGDGTGIWLHQRQGLRNRFFKYIEGWGEGYGHYIAALQKVHPDIVWGTHYLPHDADHKRQDSENVSTPMEKLQAFKLGGKWDIVDRVSDLSHGIQLTRQAFGDCWFDETGCKEGLTHLTMYRKTWNKARGCWSDEPYKDVHREGADAFRQFAQGYEAPGEKKPREKRRERNWRTA